MRSGRGFTGGATCLICSTPVGVPKWRPTGALLRCFRARRHFQNATSHTFAGKSRQLESLYPVHRARLRNQFFVHAALPLNQHGFSVDAPPKEIKATSEPRRLKCFHNGIILIVNCFKLCTNIFRIPVNSKLFCLNLKNCSCLLP